MTIDNQKLKLRSSKGKEGDDKTGTTVALVVLFGPLGFLKKGKNAVIKPGTEIKVYVDEEKKVTITNYPAACRCPLGLARWGSNRTERGSAG